MNIAPSSRQVIFTLTAFFAAPLVAALSLAFVGLLKDDSEPFTLLSLAVWTTIFYFYAAWAAVILGLPSFLLLRKLGAIRWWSASLVGLIVGILGLAFVSPRGMYSLSTDLGLCVLWGSIGALSAVVFWVIWRRGHGKRAEHGA